MWTLYSFTPVELLTRLLSATVIGALSPAAKEAPNRQSFQMLVNWKMTETTMMGPELGSRTPWKIWKTPEPPIIPARTTSFGKAPSYLRHKRQVTPSPKPCATTTCPEEPLT